MRVPYSMLKKYRTSKQDAPDLHNRKALVSSEQLQSSRTE